MSTVQPNQAPLADAFDAGRRAGLAIAAVALGVVAFLSLLGVEKAGLAIILGLLALRGRAGATTRRLAITAIGLGGSFLLTVAVVLLVYWDRLKDLIAQLEKLS